MAVELDSRLANALQVQMNREVMAALTYKQMRTDMRLSSWYGFHKIMHEAEDEEWQHARNIDHFLTERGVRPTYTTAQPQPVLYTPENPLYYFEQAMDLEKRFWVYIEDLYQLSEDLDDPDTCKFLYKMIDDQHESVDSLTILITKIKRAGMNIAALMEVDEHACKLAKQR